MKLRIFRENYQPSAKVIRGTGLKGSSQEALNSSEMNATSLFFLFPPFIFLFIYFPYPSALLICHNFSLYCFIHRSNFSLPFAYSIFYPAYSTFYLLLFWVHLHSSLFFFSILFSPLYFKPLSFPISLFLILFFSISSLPYHIPFSPWLHFFLLLFFFLSFLI